jgi:hypothetical protein
MVARSQDELAAALDCLAQDKMLVSSLPRSDPASWPNVQSNDAQAYLTEVTLAAVPARLSRYRDELRSLTSGDRAAMILAYYSDGRGITVYAILVTPRAESKVAAVFVDRKFEH